jgi:hypothetical protein
VALVEADQPAATVRNLLEHGTEWVVSRVGKVSLLFRSKREKRATIKASETTTAEMASLDEELKRSRSAHGRKVPPARKYLW